jgi:aryl-alcohol dehydrogenase-like predicted oxidoreductase
MQRRILGSTGISVSEFALGAMMFGGWGNPDHDESIRIIHAALAVGINGHLGEQRREGGWL